MCVTKRFYMEMRNYQKKNWSGKRPCRVVREPNDLDKTFARFSDTPINHHIRNTRWWKRFGVKLKCRKTELLTILRYQPYSLMCKTTCRGVNGARKRSYQYIGAWISAARFSGCTEVSSLLIVVYRLRTVRWHD